MYLLLPFWVHKFTCTCSHTLFNRRLQQWNGHAGLRMRSARTWSIQSNTLESECGNQSCHLKCPYMDCRSLCWHMYTCECVDYANIHICKHLHGLHTMRLKSQNTSTSTCDDNGPSDIISKCLILHVCLTYITCNIVGMKTDHEVVIISPDTLNIPPAKSMFIYVIIFIKLLIIKSFRRWSATL